MWSLFEVVTPAADAEARRITTAEYVGAGMTAPPNEPVLERYIDEISAQLAGICSLTDDGVNPPTFAKETCRATWFVTCAARGTKLLMPWRMPITSIATVVEAGTTLTADDDYVLAGRHLLRFSGDGETPSDWSSEKIVVTFDAGWEDLSENAPSDLQSAVAQQVKYRVESAANNSTLRSETVFDVIAKTYVVPGGDSVTKSGLLVQVESALFRYRDIAFV